jgi:O-antigen/teichoic acid export membrane protein
VALVAGFDFGPSGVVIGYLVAAGVTLIWGVASSRHILGVTFDRSDLRALLSFGVPLVWTGLAGWSLMFVDRLVLSAVVDIKDIGIYALASRVAMGLTLVIYAFNRAWAPVILEIAERDRDESQRVRVDVLRSYMAGIAWLAVTISVLADPAIGFIAGSDFSEAGDLVPVIALGLVFFALGPVLQSSMLIEQKTNLLAWTSVGAAILNLLVNLAFIPAFGVAGAAWATLVAFAAQAAAYWWLAQRLERVPYDSQMVVRLVALAGGFVASAWLPYPSGLIGLLARLAFVAGFPVCLLLLGGASLRDVRRLAGLIRR